MKNRQLLSGVILVAAWFVSGCKDSNNATQAPPAVSQKPRPDPMNWVGAISPRPSSPKAVSAKGYKPAPDLSTMVPVKTFHMKVPATFTAEQIPENQAVEFFFDGDAGQMLRVKAGQPFRIQVQPQLEGSFPLRFGADSAGNWYYALPKTCAYRVLYAPSQTTSGIQFDFLSKDDPRADPGIKPEQLAVDFGAFARSEELAIAPLYIDDDGEDYLDSQPTHLAVVHPGFDFRIMTVAANKEIFKENERMTALEAAIRAHGNGANVEELPYSAYLGGGVNLWTQPEYLEGEGWRGLHWIGSFSNGGAWCSPDTTVDELAYYFEGISNDGQFFILMRSHLSSQELTLLFRKDCPTVSSAGDIDAVSRKLNTVFQKDTRNMSSASFIPNLDQFDAVIRSLKLKPTRSTAQSE